MKKNLIIETDCGHDPDDLFTICYLAAAGVNIRCITVTPGDLDQLAIVNLLCDELGLDIPVGHSKESKKYSSGSVHHVLLEKYGRSKDGKSDGHGIDLINNIQEECDFLVIGPPNVTGKLNRKIPELMMQGGFLPYSAHNYAVERLIKFEGFDWVPTFNMNGDVKGTQAILAADIGTRRFCGKNVCHTMIFNQNHLEKMKEPTNRAAELFIQAAHILMNNYKNGEKKFHDPVAAACYLHPEIGTWHRGTPQRVKGGWTTVPGNDFVLADIDRTKFWEYIYSLA